jgi:hypothetical protein
MAIMARRNRVLVLCIVKESVGSARKGFCWKGNFCTLTFELTYIVLFGQACENRVMLHFTPISH